MTSKQNKDPKKNKTQLRVRKKERTRQEILAAAQKFFSEKPMDEVSLEDIADSAFVSRTTLYNYFKNKDDILFGLGAQIFIVANEALAENFPNNLPGNEQIIKLCTGALRASLERPLIYTIIREFFKRINSRNISLKELHTKITKSIGTPKFEKLIENFDEPYLIEFYVQLLKNTDLWIEAVRNGMFDKTIREDMKDVQIVQFVYMLMSGMVEEMELRKSTLGRIRLNEETIIASVLNLIEMFLKK